MLKKGWLPLLLALLLAFPALAEVDNAMLESAPGMMSYLDMDNVNTVIRSQAQPFPGRTDEGDTEVYAFIDFLEMPVEDVTLVRLTVSVVGTEELCAREMNISAGGKTYAFNVTRQVSEYDMMYYEDYSVCLTDQTLPLLKAIARGKTDDYAVTLTGSARFNCTLTIPGNEAAQLYDLYVDAGGTKQNLELMRSLWPATIR